MDLISIIVPIYNVQKYLPECLKSIVEQIYSNLQIILVDDGSPDLSPQICDEWALKDKRIEVIHKPNGGLSDARNCGLKYVTGNYVCFIDSDDVLNPDYVKWLHDAITENHVLLAACDIACFYDEDSIDFQVKNKSFQIYSAESALDQILNGVGIRAIACNKMYKTDILKGETFVCGKHHEDEFFTYRIIDKAKEIVFVEAPLYFYRQRAGSIMTSFSIKRLDALEAFLQRLKLLEKKYPNLYRKDKAAFCVACVSYYRYAKNASCRQMSDVEKRIKKLRRQIVFTLPELLSYSFKYQIYIIGSLFPKWACRVLKLIRGKKDE